MKINFYKLFIPMFLLGAVFLFNSKDVHAQLLSVSAGPDQAITLPSNIVYVTGTHSLISGTFSWTKVSGPSAYSIASPGSATTAITLNTGGTYVFQFTATAPWGTSGSDTMTVTVINPPPVVSAGPDQVIVSPSNSISIVGTANTYSPRTISSTNWGKVAGPSGGSVSSPSSLATNITGLINAGTYIFRLTATDNQGVTGFDDMQVTVNYPPTANAGTDIAIVSPTSTVSLTGSASDTSPGTVSSTLWTRVSGPLTYSIASPNSLTTNITGMTSAGTYVFRLTATDNQGATGFDDVQIVKTGLSVSVNAGADQAITLPTSAVSVAGTANASPDSISSTFWSKISGPAGGTFSSPGSLATNITGLTNVGTYIFRLSATSNQSMSGSDDMQVVVSNAGSSGFFNYLQVASAANGGGTITNLASTSMSALAPSTSSVSTSPLYTFPTAGTYSVRGCADPAGTITESSEANNCGSWQNITVAAAPLPDLTASALTSIPGNTTPGVATVGVPVPFGLNITNNSLTASTGVPFSNFFQVATGTNGGTGTPIDLPFTPMSTLAANSATTAFSLPYTFPSSGIYSVRGCADKTNSASTGTITESNEANNCGPWTDVTVSATPAGFSNFFQVATDANSDGAPDGALTDLVSNSMLALSSGASSVATSPSYTFSSANNYLVRNCADKTNSASTGTITESNEANNCGPWTPVAVTSSNIPPSANAGSNRSITLPTNSVTISGASESDSDGSISSRTWTRISGPNATISGGSTLTPTFSGLTAGTYQFRLTVTDNQGATGFDDMQVQVSASGGGGLSGICTVSPISAKIGQLVTWTVSNISGGSGGPYTFTWRGTDIPVGPVPPIPTSNPFSITYTTTGQKTAIATITDSSGSNSADCTDGIGNVGEDITIYTKLPIFIEN